MKLIEARRTRKQTAVTFDPDQVAALKALATTRRTSVSAIVREAVDQYVGITNRLRPDAEARL